VRPGLKKHLLVPHLLKNNCKESEIAIVYNFADILMRVIVLLVGCVVGAEEYCLCKEFV